VTHKIISEVNYEEERLSRAGIDLGHLFFSLGWLAASSSIHPIAKDAENYIPLVAGFISVFLIPVLFIFRSTISFAYLLNGMTVIIGTIAMTHFSIENHPQVWTLQTIYWELACLIF